MVARRDCGYRCDGEVVLDRIYKIFQDSHVNLVQSCKSCLTSRTELIDRRGLVRRTLPEYRRRERRLVR